MDAGVRQRSILPPISKLDMDPATNLKREEADIQAAEAILSIAPTHHSAKNSVSYPAPLAPYSAPRSPSQLTSPAESQRSIHEDRSSDAATMRQSLPSLSEALGRPQPPGTFARERSPPRSYLRRSASPRASRYSRDPEPYPPPQARHHHSTYREYSPSQQPAPRPAAYAPIGAASPSSPHPSYAHQWPMPPPPHVAHAQYGPPSAAASPSWSTSQAARPASVHQSSSFAAQPFYAQQHNDDPRSHPQSQQYVKSYPTISTASLPGSQEGPWSAGDKYGEVGRQLSSREQSDVVKRHLEHYDIETSLDEIDDGCHNLAQFSQIYKTKQQHSARSNSGTEPSIDAVKEAMRFNHKVGDALLRILNKLETQEAERVERSAQEAMEKEKASQKTVEQQNAIASAISHERRTSGPIMGPEGKKRRGRQALPGRCHSCQRSETPEWRRGPDGARTLCNACGLHYAKHARKQGANKVALGSSNLRQKPANNP